METTRRALLKTTSGFLPLVMVSNTFADIIPEVPEYNCKEVIDIVAHKLESSDNKIFVLQAGTDSLGDNGVSLGFRISKYDKPQTSVNFRAILNTLEYTSIKTEDFYEQSPTGTCIRGVYEIMRLCSYVARKSRRGMSRIIVHNVDNLESHFNTPGLNHLTFVKYNGIPKGDIFAIYKGTNIYDSTFYIVDNDKLFIQPNFDKYITRARIV